ncbi:MAG: copper-binding protein [Polaromonas sp.]|nr:copper-binding protein [Polaromonas sp.]
MKNLKTLLILASIVTASAASHAASHAGAPMAMPDTKKPATMPMAAVAEMADMADGEIRKVDIENKKITIKHGVIKNLDMPGMTMVFQVKDTAMLDKVKAGDKVRFAAEKADGAIVVTNIQPAK